MLLTSTADTLSSAYSERWQGAETSGENTYLLMDFLASNDLIFVVLFVSLIIWFVLAFYLVRVDKKINALEERFNTTEETANSTENHPETRASAVGH